ncbi:ATP-binding cassette domain-containing protein [bacterium]|nr:ATP-binding cassette domain-containing protein [bacterium]
MLKLENVGKIYQTASNLAVGIRKVNIDFSIGEFVAITGESGSGKSTLLNILSGIDSYEEGEMYVSGEETSYFSTDDLEEYRNKYVGFIFQNYNIIDSYTVLENVEASLLFINLSKEERRAKALELIKRVGLSKRLHTKASKLSGGEKQRVVIARALAKDPPIIAADEPTGNLDSKTSKEIIDLIYEVSKDKLVLIVTHDFNEVKDYATRLVRIYDGEIKEDKILKEVEKSDLPNLFDTPKTKMKMKDNIFLSIKDLLSSPKRFIFYTLVFLILSILVTSSLAFYRYLEIDSMYDSLVSYNYFRYRDERRIVIGKNNKEAFSESELNEFKNSQFVKFVVENDYFIDSTYGNYYSIENPYDDSSFIYNITLFTMCKDYIAENDLTGGRLPENDNEVVISVTSDMLNDDYDDALDYLDKKLKNVYKTTTEEYKVVGVIDVTSSNIYSSTIYLNTNKFEKFKKEYYFSEFLSTMFRSSSNNLFYEYFINYEISPDLNDDEFAFKGRTAYEVEDLNNRYSPFLSEYGTLTVSNYYSKLDLDLKLNKDKNIIESSDSPYYFIILLSESNYNKIVDTYDDIYQISVFLDNVFDLERFKNRIDESKYSYIVPSEANYTIDGLERVVSAVYITFVSMFLFAVFFITYAVLLNSVRSRKEDVEILRTIGAKKENITRLFASQMIFSTIISFILTIIIYFILRLTATSQMFKDVLKAVNIFDFMTILIILIVMVILLNVMFSKRAFKKTIKKSLEAK